MPIFLKLLLIGIVLAAAYFDLRVRRIPNALNLAGIVAGLTFHTAFAGWSGIGLAIGGLLAALCVYIPLYALKGMGAGDVKLMAAVGAIVGPGNWLNIFLVTALIGGLAGITLVLLRRKTGQTFFNLSVIIGQLLKGRAPSDQDSSLSIHSEKSLKLPHGAVIAAAVAVFLVATWGR